MIALSNAVRAHAEDARQFVYRVLAFHIRNMLLLPDQKLSEAEASAQLGVSRTPVHDTFAQLSRENMLLVEPQRGTFVRRLDAEHIRQLVWINRTTAIAVLENLYTVHHPKSKLEVFQRLADAEAAALKNGDFEQMAKLDGKFYLEVYNLAGFLPLYRTLWKNSVDLYRLARMDNHKDYWGYIAAQHAAIARAILSRDHDPARTAVIRQYEAVELLLSRMLRKNPQYFKEQETR